MVYLLNDGATLAWDSRTRFDDLFLVGYLRQPPMIRLTHISRLGHLGLQGLQSFFSQVCKIQIVFL